MALVQLGEDNANGNQQYDRYADQDPKSTRRVRFDEPEKRGEAKIGGAVDGSNHEHSEGEDGYCSVANSNVPFPPWREL